jgi:KDO2-lipid IV(A) lauroyltransferase
MVGLKEMEDALAEGKGVVLITGHMGNWEMGGAALAARGIPLDGVAQRQRNPLFDADITRNRERLGMRIIPRGRAPRLALRSLRKGRVTALVADQNARRSELFVDFFGRKAATARGPAVFALRTGSAIFVGSVLRLEGALARYRVAVSRVAFQATGDQDEDVRRLTEIHTQFLERAIREAPEQYFWQHRRWKTRPPGESGD